MPTEGEMVCLQRTANQYPEKSYDDLVAIVREVRDTLDQDLLGKLTALAAAQQKGQEALDDKEAELREWLAKKDPEPTRKEEVVRNRERLRLTFTSSPNSN